MGWVAGQALDKLALALLQQSELQTGLATTVLKYGADTCVWLGAMISTAANGLYLELQYLSSCLLIRSRNIACNSYLILRLLQQPL